MKYEMSSGVRQTSQDTDVINMTGGVLYVKGKVGTIIQRGGVLYDQRKSELVEIRQTSVDDEERKRYQDRISELSRQLSESRSEAIRLQAKVNELSSVEAPLPDDDVLVRRIIQLKDELSKEQEAHQKDIVELQYRLDTALEVNAKLRKGITETNHNSQLIADEHIDILATLLCLYPYTPTADLELEFGIPQNKIRFVADVLGAIKSKEARQEAVDYLQRQHRELIQRRGGDQGNNAQSKKVEKVARNGRLVATYDSINEAAEANGCDHHTISSRCSGKTTSYTKDGYKYRYKKQEERV